MMNIAFACLVVVLVTMGRPAAADTELDFGNDVRVENVRVSAAGIGADAQLRLLIVNDGQSPLHLLRIASAAAEGSRIEMEIGPGRSVRLEMLTIPPNEGLNFETFHQRIFLARLKRNLVSGEELPIRFDFLEGELSAVAHVH